MIQFRPARREHTPLIIGLAGPTKSGKTYSAHRLAVGLANGGPIAMINAEGAKGHAYADTFNYIAADLARPFRPQRYTEALRAALALKPHPAVIIIDSCSHMHDGPGGLLEWHNEELDRLAGDNQKERDKKNWTAWIKPKAAENEFIYTMLEADECHLILCFRAKEKLKIVTGKPPIDLGWQPIAGDRVAFETIFTLVLPPHCKGVPDLAVSELRTPFDKLIPAGKQLDEETGRKLAEWAAGSTSVAAAGAPPGQPPAETTVTEPESLLQGDRVPPALPGTPDADLVRTAAGSTGDHRSGSVTVDGLELATDAQQKLILSKAAAAGLDDDTRHNLIESLTGQPSTKAIPKAMVNVVLAEIARVAA